MSQFNRVRVPETWERYWTRYPEGYTILESLLEWVAHLDNLTTNINDWNKYLDNFVKTFDKNLQGKVKDILEDWLADGVFGDLFAEVVLEEMTRKINVLHNPLNFLDHQERFTAVTNTDGGEVDFIQGFAINQDKKEMYIVRKDNTKANNQIARYDLETMTLKDKKRFTTSTGCYNEGLPYFYNDAGQLCFIVRTSYDHMAAIYNYTANTLGTAFVCQGSSKHGCDPENKYYFAHFGDAERVEGVFLYDFNSVKEGSPKLLRKIHFPNSIAGGEKIQSMTIVDEHMILGHGKLYPEISAVNFDGDVVQHKQLQKTSLINMLGENYNPYTYENEGLSWWKEGGKYYPVIGHCVVEASYTYFCKVGHFDYTKVKTAIYKDGVTNGLTWKDVTFTGDATNYGTDVTVQYAKTSYGTVKLRGVATYTRTHSDGSVGVTLDKTLFTLPFPYYPFRNQWFLTTASGSADRTNRVCVQSGGNVILESVYDQGGTAKPFCCLDGIEFFVDTRPN